MRNNCVFICFFLNFSYIIYFREKNILLRYEGIKFFDNVFCGIVKCLLVDYICLS